MPEQAPGTARKGYHQTLQLLDLADPLTAIYAVSDKSARGAYQAITERGLQVGVDVSVIGTDNVEESAFRSPPLTTFDVRAGELGRQALRLLVQVLEGEDVPRHVTVRGEMVHRASAGPPPAR
jgi:LacI family transcriptional regulator